MFEDVNGGGTLDEADGRVRRASQYRQGEEVSSDDSSTTLTNGRKIRHQEKLKGPIYRRETSEGKGSDIFEASREASHLILKGMADVAEEKRLGELAKSTICLSYTPSAHQGHLAQLKEAQERHIELGITEGTPEVADSNVVDDWFVKKKVINIHYADKWRMSEQGRQCAICNDEIDEERHDFICNLCFK